MITLLLYYFLYLFGFKTTSMPCVDSRGGFYDPLLLPLASLATRNPFSPLAVQQLSAHCFTQLLIVIAVVYTIAPNPTAITTTSPAFSPLVSAIAL